MVEIISWIFLLIVIIAALYGVNAMILTLIFLFGRIRKHDPTIDPTPSIGIWPTVTIQLPIYNEFSTAQRVIDSAARMDYPLDRLTIQVLDDSTDETTRLAAQRVDYWKTQGRNISLIRRPNRSEYKAGNLRNGMELDHSEFLAIFDADFLPAPDWLRRSLNPFFEPGGESVGMVQTRWLHVNESQSLLTQALSKLLDAHFGIEQPVRSRERWFGSFNGSGGIWRRRCIEESGGWRGDTLSEDLDLSFRAQLKGWTFRYLQNVTAPDELPASLTAFKIQQFRWAKGCMQAMVLHARKILAAPASLWKKIQGVYQISIFLVDGLLVLMVLLSFPLALANSWALRGIPMALLGLGATGGPVMIAGAEWNLHPDRSWWKRILWMPILLLLGTGIAVSNAKAVAMGILNIPSPFQRTPRPLEDERGKRTIGEIWKTIQSDSVMWWEILLAAVAMGTVVIDLRNGNWPNAAYFLAYAAGFGWVGLATLMEAYRPLFQKIFSSKKNGPRAR
jgi:cellulose synthase/poly-beta-1,6-N-acetylglucosamine synthase-like glycosyltransferase